MRIEQGWHTELNVGRALPDMVGAAHLLTQEESAEWPFEAQDVALYHLRENMPGESAARGVANVQSAD